MVPYNFLVLAAGVILAMLVPSIATNPFLCNRTWFVVQEDETSLLQVTTKMKFHLLQDPEPTDGASQSDGAEPTDGAIQTDGANFNLTNIMANAMSHAGIWSGEFLNESGLPSGEPSIKEQEDKKILEVMEKGEDQDKKDVAEMGKQHRTDAEANGKSLRAQAEKDAESSAPGDKAAVKASSDGLEKMVEAADKSRDNLADSSTSQRDQMDKDLRDARDNETQIELEARNRLAKAPSVEPTTVQNHAAAVNSIDGLLPGVIAARNSADAAIPGYAALVPSFDATMPGAAFSP